MAEPVALKYRAFISYSHIDASWAKWLYRGLEGFRIDKDLIGLETATGTISKTLRPIFRDRDDFTAGHTLTEQTLAALDASHALIVICSPAAAKSRYVTEEVRLFKSRHPGRPVIPLRPEEEKMKLLPQVLFWLGIMSIPLAWLIWYFGPELEPMRPVLSGVDDPALRAVLQEAHAERLGIWVATWPVTLLVLSFIVEKKVQG